MKYRSNFSTTPGAPGWSIHHNDRDAQYLGPIGETDYHSFIGDLEIGQMSLLVEDTQYNGGVVIAIGNDGRSTMIDLSITQIEDLSKKLKAHLKWAKSLKPVRRGPAEGQ